MKKYLILLLIFSYTLICSATHLVGGEMTYTCLGGNQYEIRLVIYRDCGPTNVNGTGFDLSGIISIYNSENIEVESITISDPVSTILSNETVGNDCLELPTDLCIEQGVYTVIVNLPPIEGGYQIAYQRCCRNPSIINIPTPGDFGSTFTAHIPGPDEATECNSSATFNNYPPLALCIGDEINIDLSATDIDGDSLVYELTTPFHGSNDVNPTEISPPPFTPIPWSVGYSETYPLDSSPAITININNGLITGTPTAMGMFIIGIKVSEYREGILINEIIRDFRFLVVDCNVTTASFPLSSWYCNTLEVEFSNNSNNSETYLWDFGDEGASSSLFEPTYTYPDTGLYTVTLIANPNTICADTNTVTFPLYTELIPYFEDPDPQCIDNNSFDLFGEGIAPPGTTFSWNFGSSANPTSSNIPNPTGISFNNPGSYPVSYNLQYNDCDETYIGTIEVFEEDIFPEIPLLEAQCFENNSFDFTANGIYPSNSSFSWDFGPNADPQNSTQQNPTEIQFSSSGVQNITLSVFANGCENSNTSTIEIFDQIPIQIFSSPENGCEPFTVEFESNIPPDNHQFNWDLGNGSTANTNNTQSTYMEGIYDISLNVINTLNNCEGSLLLNNYVTVLPEPISDFTINSDTYMFGDPIWINNFALLASTYTYEFSSGYITNEVEPEYILNSIGNLEVIQYAYNEFECVDSSSQYLFIDFQHTFWVPNTFTPNNDSDNDLFFPVCTDVDSYRMQIFNRWGEQVYDQNGEQPKWDGNDKFGIKCSTDSYVYLIDYKTIDNSMYSSTGVVNLIR